MSRRKTVKLNLEVVLPLIKEKCRSNVVFCEKMGRPTQKTWVTGWSNKPKPKNPPSPEEAARMCVLLKTTPDEILLREGETPEETAKCLKDIETVRKLVEAEGIKESTPDSKTEGEDAQLAQLIAGFSRLSPQQKSAVLAVIEGYQPSQE
jgi:hypothetical protein